MNEAARTCPKCDGAMTVGVVLNGLQGGQLMPCWVEGIPEQTYFGNLKLRNVRAMPVSSFRCGACGYIELFAPPPNER